MSNVILLNGAGFSANWGGYLAGEMWNKIISVPAVHNNQQLKNIIWDYREKGFEAVFGDSRIEKFIEDYRKAIIDVFFDMHQEFYNVTSENSLFENFFFKFSSIFTLNQDIFFESLWSGCWLGAVDRHNPNLGCHRYGLYYPYLKNVHSSHYILLKSHNNSESLKNLNLDILEIDLNWKPDALSIYGGRILPIPYFKLHGSINFNRGKSLDSFIMGTSKLEQIEGVGLLSQYLKDFQFQLATENTKLLIIGYSFSDHHINQKIFEAIKSKQLKIGVISPASLDTLISNVAKAEHLENSNKGLEELKPETDVLFKEGLILYIQNKLQGILGSTDFDSIKNFVTDKNNVS